MTVWEVRGSVVMDTDGNNGEKTSSNYHLVEEEFTIAVPLVRPNPAFLTLLQLAGATNEVFTMKEILHYMKLYIVERRLFDEYNPRIVHCQDELLGEVLQVKQFSIDEVLGLISKCCTQLPDTCLKRRRRLVSKPQQPSTITNYQPSISVSSNTPTSVTISLCPSVRPSECLSSNPPPQSSSLSSSSSSVRTNVARKPVEKCCTVSRKSSSSSCDISDSNVSNIKNNNVDTESSMVTKATKEQENTVTSGTSSQCNIEDSSESEKSTSSRKRKKKGNGKNEGSGRKRHKTEPGMTTTGTSNGESSRRRGTSLSITYSDDNINKDYPWYFQVELGDDDDDDKSEVLSVQGKDTVIVQDSTDDLWFLEEESISLEVPSDTNFSVEYDVESDVSPGTESDLSSVRSGEGLLLICKESDVEFFADCSDSETDDGDKELSAADNWNCTECGLSNPPIQRYCNRCWKLRSDWLPSQLSSKMEDDKLSTRKSTTDTGLKDTDLFNKLSFNKDTDSGISSTLPSSQESLCADSDKLNKLKCVPDIPSLSRELHNNDSRCTFSNFQLENENKTSVGTIGNDSAFSTVNSSYKIDSSKYIDTSAASAEDRCMICLTGAKTASLIHGSSGHQVCCYSCAKRLKRRGKLCPVCRRPIQKVVRNYIL